MNEFIEIEQGLYRLDESGMVLVWLIVGRDKALLIDTGLGLTDLKKEISKITSLPLTVVNTHIHIDHAGGDGQFETVFCHQGDADIIAHYYSDDELKQFAISLLGHPELFSDWHFGKAAHTKYISGNTVFDLGGETIHVVELPGHSLGSIGFYWQERKLLFGGDAITQTPVWLHVDTGISVEEYGQGLAAALERYPDICRILPSHSYRGDGMKKGHMQELYELTQEILLGQAQCRPIVTAGMSGIIARRNNAMIIYKPERLLKA